MGWKDAATDTAGELMRFANPAIDVLDALYKTKYNASDLRPVHEAIAAIVEKNGKILMLNHVKLNFWTIPIGKIEIGQTIEKALKQELKEEINIIPVKYTKVTQFSKKYKRGKTTVRITSHIFRIDHWRGSIKNNEPEKHRALKWMSMKDLQMMKRAKKLSDSTLYAMAYMK
jgi:ADP-ribose pyrophosphatase YjhB (NUDIX family)